MTKFKNTEELEKAYKELEKEFTKKSQKLAEVEKTNYVTLLHNEMDNLLNDYAKRRIFDLEAKLAESEERIKELTECNQCLQIYRNQDKISFAVEQLEQVKYYILTTQQDADYLVDKEQVNIHFFKDVIDNQIKKLTHQHEDKSD